MARITKILRSSNGERVWIYIDGLFCCSVRSRTFPAMGLEVGTDVTCEQVMFLERYFWKLRYGTESWERESLRLKRVTEMIKWADSNAWCEIGDVTNPTSQQKPGKDGPVAG